MTTRPQFRISMPRITLPADLGAKPALVLQAQAPVGELQWAMCVCMDIDGVMHTNVPVMQSTLRFAMANSMVKFIEAPEVEAPELLILPPTG